MNKKALLLAVSALLLTGCSNQSPDNKTEYDPVELIRYETCLKVLIEKSGYKLTDGLTMPQIMEKIDGFCDFMKPQKR
jgi:PBP1b-binding outer membrane lipoprotein LpoB